MQEKDSPKPKLYDAVKFMDKHFRENVKVYMRRDSQSKHVPEVIEGELVHYDTRSGLLILNTKEKHIILDNRGARSHLEISRGKK